ncbi:MAG: aminoglycoside phosphotransferase family protein [Acidobacteriota bacterium]|nr:aminoglycoside phosphotransferase family protein [Acidobacteriota bacterium]
MTKARDTSTREFRQAKEMANAIIEHHFGKQPKRIVSQGSGLSNFVFLIDHDEGEFVVRISSAATKINAFIKEQWAIAKAREVGVPTPDVLEVGNEVIPRPYMISSRVKAREATHHPNRLAILKEMGRYAAMINSIRTTGFGSTFDWTNNKLSLNKTWGDYLFGELNLEDRLKTLEKGRMLPPPQFKKLRATLESAAKSSFKPALNHGDIRLKNVMVDEEGKIKAIIDWEDSTSNLAPQWELSLALHDLSIDEKQEFLKGYGLPAKKLAQTAPLMKAINIINYAPKIKHLLESKDKAKLEQYRMRLSGALDLYLL